MTEDQKFLNTIVRHTGVLHPILACFIVADVMLFFILLRVFNFI